MAYKSKWLLNTGDQCQRCDSISKKQKLLFQRLFQQSSISYGNMEAEFNTHTFNNICKTLLTEI